MLEIIRASFIISILNFQTFFENYPRERLISDKEYFYRVIQSNDYLSMQSTKIKLSLCICLQIFLLTACEERQKLQFSSMQHCFVQLICVIHDLSFLFPIFCLHCVQQKVLQVLNIYNLYITYISYNQLLCCRLTNRYWRLSTQDSCGW